MARLTFAEMETVLQYDRTSDVARVYTHDQALMKSLERRKVKPTQEHTHGGRVVAKSYEVPKGILSVGLKPVRSAAQVAAAKESGRRLVARQRSKKLLGPGTPTSPAEGNSSSGARRASR